MKRQRYALALAVAVLAAVAAIVPSSASTRVDSQTRGVSLTIWDYFINSPKERAALMRVANEWARKTGNRVTNPGDVAESMDRYALAARSGRGPDILQFPHDNLGRFAAPSLLAPPPSGFLVNRKLYAPVGIQAATYKGKLYGLPIARETTLLFYNRALVPRVPATWNALITTAKRLTSGERYGFLFSPEFYYSYAFIGGYGGYVFQRTKAGLNPKRLGVATTGAVQGLRFIQDLVQTHKLVPPTTNYDTMDGKFANGQAAMVINGPWAVQNYTSKGIRFGVAPLPKLANGKSPTPFVGVQMLGVNSRSRNTRAAWDLVRYLSTHLPMPLYRASGRVPATVAASNSRLVKSNAVTQAIIAASNKGQPMPNIPEMGSVWTPANNALQLLVQGKLTPQQAAAEMRDQIAKAIAQSG